MGVVVVRVVMMGVVVMGGDGDDWCWMVMVGAWCWVVMEGVQWWEVLGGDSELRVEW